MRLYSVIPIARGFSKETLSYFGGGAIELGSLVNIPLRTKIGFGIVIGAKDVHDVKTEIRKGSFAIKKISKVVSKQFLTKEFVEAASETAQFYATTTGPVLETLIPKLVLENVTKIHLDKEPPKNKISAEKLAVQADEEERFAHYKSFIRGQFAKNASVCFVLPTLEDIRQAKNILEKGIEQYTVTLHSGLSKKEFQDAYSIIQKEKHPLLIISTAPFLSLERKDLGSIILDRENSRSYKSLSRPFIDYRKFVEYFAKNKRIPLLLGDILLSIETLHKVKEETYAEFAPIKMRALSPAEGLLVDMKSKKGEFQEKFRILSPELESLIDKTKAENEHLFIWSGRKGLAPTTVCGDCGKVVTCSRCNTPVTLYGGKGEKENFFFCNKCGLERDTRSRCTHCDSWKLQTLGVGIEAVESEIQKLFPDLKIFRLDKESVKTEKKALDIVKRFEATPGSVLIGTELALFYLKHDIENVAIASVDSMLSLPDFRIREKILYHLIALRARAQKTFVIQTRNAEEMLFDYALKGNMADFYKDEIKVRETFSYPPFSLFIKISIEGKRQSVALNAEEISEFLKDFEPKVYESFSPSVRGNTIFHILIRREPQAWPNQELLERLSFLPPQVTIRVDPESLL